jgi:hypothetical protein
MRLEIFWVIIEVWIEKEIEENGLNWFNLAKIERNLKFKVDLAKLGINEGLNWRKNKNWKVNWLYNLWNHF